MTMQVTSVNIRYNNEDAIDTANVRFQGFNGDIRINGNITLTASEYEGNEATSALETIVKNRIADSLSAESSEG